MADPRPEPLIFPTGVRFPREGEFPAEHEEERARIAAANITTGWVETDFADRGYAAYFEVNVHAPHVWQVVRDIAEAILPNAAAPIVGRKDEEPVLGPYTTRDAAVAVFEPFVKSLQHDGFIAFGLIFHRGGRTEEVFVEFVKYLKIWTNRPTAVRAVLSRHALPEVPGLQFIDEYPRISERLATPQGDAGWPEPFDGLRDAFAQLPPPPATPDWAPN